MLTLPSLFGYLKLRLGEQTESFVCWNYFSMESNLDKMNRITLTLTTIATGLVAINVGVRRRAGRGRAVSGSGVGTRVSTEEQSLRDPNGEAGKGEEATGVWKLCSKGIRTPKGVLLNSGSMPSRLTLMAVTEVRKKSRT